MPYLSLDGASAIIAPVIAAHCRAKAHRASTGAWPHPLYPLMADFYLRAKNAELGAAGGGRIADLSGMEECSGCGAPVNTTISAQWYGRWTFCVHCKAGSVVRGSLPSNATAAERATHAEHRAELYAANGLTERPV